MANNVITEEILEPSFVAEEKEAGNKDYYIEGIFLQSNLKNRNGRTYPKPVLTEAVNVYFDNFISKNRGYGELGHPSEPGIHFDQVCILTKSLKEDGNNFIGKAKVIDTPAGRIVKTLIDEGVSLGVSSRGMGAIKNGVVQNGFRLVTAVDVVADPSAPDAFVSAVMEGTEWIMQDGKLLEVEVEKMRDSIKKANKAHLREAEDNAWLQFMNKLKGI